MRSRRLSFNVWVRLIYTPSYEGFCCRRCRRAYRLGMRWVRQPINDPFPRKCQAQFRRKKPV